MIIHDIDWQILDVAIFTKWDKEHAFGFALEVIYGGKNKWYMKSCTGTWLFGDDGLPGEGELLVYNNIPVQFLKPNQTLIRMKNADK